MNNPNWYKIAWKVVLYSLIILLAFHWNHLRTENKELEQSRTQNILEIIEITDENKKLKNKLQEYERDALERYNERIREVNNDPNSTSILRGLPEAQYSTAPR